MLFKTKYLIWQKFGRKGCTKLESLPNMLYPKHICPPNFLSNKLFPNAGPKRQNCKIFMTVIKILSLKINCFCKNLLSTKFLFNEVNFKYPCKRTHVWTRTGGIFTKVLSSTTSLSTRLLKIPILHSSPFIYLKQQKVCIDYHSRLELKMVMYGLSKLVKETKMIQILSIYYISPTLNSIFNLPGSLVYIVKSC